MRGDGVHILIWELFYIIFTCCKVTIHISISNEFCTRYLKNKLYLSLIPEIFEHKSPVNSHRTYLENTTPSKVLGLTDRYTGKLLRQIMKSGILSDATMYTDSWSIYTLSLKLLNALLKVLSHKKWEWKLKWNIEV